MTGFTPIDPPAKDAIRRRGAARDRADVESCGNKSSTPAIEPFKSFPVDVLPEPLRGFVNVGAKAIGCDASFIVLPMLSAIASVIGNSRVLQLKPGWLEPCVIWAAIIGESGSWKTPAFRFAMKPLRDLQRDEMRAFKDRETEYERKMMHYDKEVKSWKSSKGTDDPPEKPEEPQAARLIVGDVTVEALAPILQANWRGVLLARDELGGWISSFDRYAAGNGADVAHWLSAFNAETLVVDRKTGSQKTLLVERAAVSVIGGIQPGTLQRALGIEHRENGLLARLLLAYPPKRPKQWTDAAIPPEQEALIGSLFDRLRELRPNTFDDHIEPVTVRFTPEGKLAWVVYYNTHAKEQVELSGELAAAWSKLECYAARLALVVHFIRWAADDPTLCSPDAVDEISVAAGITMSRWFGHEVRRVYAMLSESECDRNRRQLVELIERRGGSATSRDLMRSSRHFPTTEDAEAALHDLESVGFGRMESTHAGSRGGRPTKRFRLYDTADVDNTPTGDGVAGSIVNVNTVNGTEAQ